MRAFALAILLSSTCFSQVIVQRTFLLRAETTTFDPYSGMSHICVLVYPDGKYHLEKTYQDRGGDKPETKVYVNQLADAGLKQLMATLDNPDLQAIHTPERHGGIIQNLETLLITVPREHTMQNITFENPDQRKPYDKTLKPFMGWMKDIQKKKVPVAKEEASNNCSPPQVMYRTTMPTPTGTDDQNTDNQ